MNNSDWQGKFKERLVKYTIEAINNFSLEHDDEEVSYFAFDSSPEDGEVLTCFNTTESSNFYIKERNQRDIETTKDYLNNDFLGKKPYRIIKSYSVLPFCNNTGDFKYQGYTYINFPEWKEFSESESYPKSSSEDDDYLENNVSKLFWEVLNELADQGKFNSMNCSVPFLLGFGFHDHSQYVVRMINV